MGGVARTTSRIAAQLIGKMSEPRIKPPRTKSSWSTTGNGLPGFILSLRLTKAPRRSPRTAPRAIMNPPRRRLLSTRDSATPMIVPAMTPAKNPRTVLWDPKILLPSIKFRPPSRGLPPPKRRGAAFATYEGPMNNSASEIVDIVSSVLAMRNSNRIVKSWALGIFDSSLAYPEESSRTRNLSAIHLLKDAFPDLSAGRRPQPYHQLRPMSQGSSGHGLNRPFSKARLAVDLTSEQSSKLIPPGNIRQVGKFPVQFSIVGENLFGLSQARPIESSDRIDHQESWGLGQQVLQGLGYTDLVLEILWTENNYPLCNFTAHG